MNIFILGYAGSGKTFFGQEISKGLGKTWNDLDHLVEALEGDSISSIFSKKGEAYFRTLEIKVLRQWINDTANGILSLGGGTPCTEETIQYLLRNGICIYIQRPLSYFIDNFEQIKTGRPRMEAVVLDQREQFLVQEVTMRATFYEQSQVIIDGNDPNALQRTINALKLSTR